MVASGTKFQWCLYVVRFTRIALAKRWFTNLKLCQERCSYLEWCHIFRSLSWAVLLAIINRMYKCAIWVIMPLVTGSEACNNTWLCLVQLQASEPVTHGNIIQIAHLAMLLIIQMFVRTYVHVCIQLPDEHCTT